MKIPFIKLIQSLYYYYFFDVNKNQLLRIPEAAYRNLEQWLQSGVEPIGDSTINRLIKMGYLSSNKAEKTNGIPTALLAEGATTDLLTDENTTTLLNNESAVQEERTGGRKLAMLDEVILIHTDEVIS